MESASRNNQKRPSFPPDAIAVRDQTDLAAQRAAFAQLGMLALDAAAIDHALRMFGALFSARRLVESARELGDKYVEMSMTQVRQQEQSLRRQLGDANVDIMLAHADDIDPIYEAENALCKQLDGW